MRLWHKDLIRYLPKQQLLGQWREICCIANDWAMTRTPNHILVNAVLNYPLTDFVTYCNMVYRELIFRNYRITPQVLDRLNQNIRSIDRGKHSESVLKVGETHSFLYDIFSEWHNDRYLLQCYFNLEEKHDRGGIPEDEWLRVDDYVSDRLEYLL